MREGVAGKPRIDIAPAIEDAARADTNELRASTGVTPTKRRAIINVEQRAQLCVRQKFAISPVGV
jgi:hypothetical protein